ATLNGSRLEEDSGPTPKQRQHRGNCRERHAVRTRTPQMKSTGPRAAERSAEVVRPLCRPLRLCALVSAVGRKDTLPRPRRIPHSAFWRVQCERSTAGSRIRLLRAWAALVSARLFPRSYIRRPASVHALMHRYKTQGVLKSSREPQVDLTSDVAEYSSTRSATWISALVRVTVTWANASIGNIPSMPSLALAAPAFEPPR